MPSTQTEGLVKHWQREADHQVISLPVYNFSEVPQNGEKKEISLHQEKGAAVLRAFLIEVSQDPLNLAGEKAKLEVHEKDLPLIKDYKGSWFVYPPMNSTGAKNDHEGFREITL